MSPSVPENTLAQFGVSAGVLRLIPQPYPEYAPHWFHVEGNHDDGNGGASETDHDENGQLWTAWSPADWSHMDEFVPKSQEADSGDGVAFLEGREVTRYSVAWRSETERAARNHLLQHHYAGVLQEDIALATWFPADGATRYTAVIDEIILPARDERILKGNVQMTRDYLRRGRQIALAKGAGMAVMHNHLRPGWQDMSLDDITMESRSVSNPCSRHRVAGRGANARYRRKLECPLLDSKRRLL